MKFTSNIKCFDTSNANRYGMTISLAYRRMTGDFKRDMATRLARQAITRVVDDLLCIYDAPKAKVVQAMLTNRLDALPKFKADVPADSLIAVWADQIETAERLRKEAKAEKHKERRMRKQQAIQQQRQRELQARRKANLGMAQEHAHV